ncbi:hypothetical protein GY21_05240 [Cryobacterium roopkundense]|uniref:DNA-binding Lrp family transcriptional regulator n=1 Tax=Cryobacterium roopkundense TaxID=1001240 RepID=A0A099JP45_9MICO|nr:Lrp/AsnC family transcriptional regulator [Cryobacterium roopkundense]KGJ79417.1 hypothetical protein GY21_05240 [Cryobacterium roopkundense]MBB5639859.1 DNA-binding Lrp family transcriptional regulator [Cryobacterium roopkundense]
MFDDLDRTIVGALHLAPRATWDDLASALPVDASTLSRRYARLANENVLRIVGEIDWGLFSTTLPVHLRIETRDSTPLAVAQRLEGLPDVQHLGLTFGRFPLFATVHAASEAATLELLMEIYALPGVSAITTLPVLAYASKGSGWDPQVLSADETRRFAEIGRPPGAAPGSPQAPVSLEPLERKALQLLQQDARLPASSLGRTLGVATSTASRMVKKFIAEGWFRARVEIDGTYLGYALPFVLGVKTELNATGAVCQALARHPATRFVTQVAAEFDVLCTGLARDRSHLAQLVNDEFGAISGVRALDVAPMLLECKRFWMLRGENQRLGAFTPPSLGG